MAPPKWLLAISFFSMALMGMTAGSSCGANFFDCKNGRCVAPFFVCDDDNDCGNFEDELNCFTNADNNKTVAAGSVTPCPADHFSCGDDLHSCLPLRWVCDGYKECSNGADEANCTTKGNTCGDDFSCAAGNECIPAEWKCDGLNDCADNSDEANCTHITALDANCDKEHGHFQCATGECILYSSTCDGKMDCHLGDDEGVICHLPACLSSNCSHLCALNPKTNASTCLCPGGYQLKNGTTCVDFDECSDNKMTNMCSQQCINEEGSHRCACDAGYKLMNGSRCVTESGPAILFYSFDDQIRAIDLKDNRVTDAYTGNPAELITELDVDIGRRKLYFISTKFGSHGSLFEADFDGDYRLSTPRPIMINDKLSGIEGISVDYLAGNVYITDSARNTIIVCRTATSLCLTLITGRRQPRAILVLPHRAELYWSEWGNIAGANGIYTSGMDGTTPHLLIGNLTWPNGLAYDEARNRIYWTDGSHGKVEYYDLDINVRHHVFEDHRRQPFSIHAFEDNLYWSDWTANEIVTQDKITGHHLRPFIFNSDTRFLGLALYHPLLQQQSSGYNPCGLSPCSHICLIKSSHAYTCACPDHMTLAATSSAHECQVIADEPYVLASTGRRLYKFYPSEIASGHSEEVPVPSNLLIGDLAYDSTAGAIYLYDARSASIGRLSHRKGRPHYEQLITTDIALVSSLHHEAGSGSLYWVDYVNNLVQVYGLSTRRRLTLFDTIAQPISLALYSPSRLLYIGARSHPARIYSSYLDGSSLRQILETRHGGIPIAMLRRSRTLIWADPNLGRIEQIATDGLSVRGSPLKINTRPVGAIHSLDAHNDTLFWTNADSAKIFYSEMTTTPSMLLPPNALRRVTTRDLPANGLFNTEDVRLVIVQKPSNGSFMSCTAPTAPSCAHLCLLGATGPVCRCEAGFITTDKGITCIPDPTKPVHPTAVTPKNSTDSMQTFWKSIEDIFNPQDTLVDGDDYVITNRSDLIIDVTTSRPKDVVTPPPTTLPPSTHIEIVVDPISPRLSPLRAIAWAFACLLAIAAGVLLLCPDVRRTVINITLSSNTGMARNVSTTRFFRNPNYHTGTLDEKDTH